MKEMLFLGVFWEEDGSLDDTWEGWNIYGIESFQNLNEQYQVS